jgi:colicin import membrane protein
VRSNWILPPDLQGNPEAIFDVVQLPTGEVLSTRLVKSSGNPAYDAAVERAILKSSPLPLPAARELFARELKLTFRPQDK